MVDVPTCQMKDGSVAPKITIVNMPGSHYGGKVVMGFDALGVPYKADLIMGMYPPKELKKRTPASKKDKPYTSVPTMELVADKTDIRDSSAILQWVDDNMDGRFKFYPRGCADEVRAAEKALDHLALYIIYYHWCSDAGFTRTIAKFVRRQAPCLWPCVPSLPPMTYGKKRFKTMLPDMLPEAFTNGVADRNDEKANAAFVAEIQKMEAYFKNDKQQFMCETEDPSAADFFLAAILHSAVGHLGDAKIPPFFPDILTEANAPRLGAFFARMQQYPLKFKHKNTS